MTRRTETVVIGAGQAGLSLSRYLSRDRRPHVVLDRGRLGERWRSERWDSLTLLSPNWLNRLDGAPAHADVDGFLGRNAFVDYLARYARANSTPLREHVEVRSVSRSAGGFRVATDDGTWQADNVVIATGDSADPFVPRLAAAGSVRQIHSSAYRNPASLPPGGILVVGAGPTGQQLAAELRRAGRTVVLSAGGHGRMVRRYRGHDIFRWLEALGELAQPAGTRPREAGRTRSLAVTGARGGEQLDLPLLADLGVVLAGRLERLAGTEAAFAPDLAANAAAADLRLARVLDRVDEHLDEDWPHEPVRPAPAHLGDGPARVDLRADGITTIIWATGYRRLYPWLDIDVLDPDGEIVHEGGVTPVEGLYLLGRNFQRRRSSHFIGGVGADAAFLARLIGGRQRPATALRQAPAWAY
jgi:putative flavoprotein involved in K+ transport